MRISLAAAALLLVSGNAFAASPTFCEAYAKRAADTAQRASDLSCGFPSVPGPGDPPWANAFWSPKSEVHMQWCISPTTTEEQANDDTDARAYLIGHCAQCRDYSDKALAAESDNIKYACGFEKSDPATWQTGEGHFDFCMSASTEALSISLPEKTRGRSDAIAQCIADKQDQIAACNRIVAEIKDTAHSNVVLQCAMDFKGPEEFADDDGVRFAYCMATLAPLGSYYGYASQDLQRDADNFNVAVNICIQHHTQALKLKAARIPCTGRGTMFRPSPECNVSPGIITKKSVGVTHAITAKPTQNDGSIRARKDTASSKIIGPGLLEGSGEVFSPQGPSGTGTPRVGASSAPAVVAPPPTVYHR